MIELRWLPQYAIADEQGRVAQMPRTLQYRMWKVRTSERDGKLLADCYPYLPPQWTDWQDVQEAKP